MSPVAQTNAVVLDRDGTLIEHVPYLSSVQDIQLLPGVIDACQLLKAHNIKLYIATNQSGIGRGYYTEDDYRGIETYVHRLFESHGIGIEQTFYCPFHPEHGVGQYKRESHDRKPNPGMIERAIAHAGVDAAEVVMVGDNVVDIQAAQAAGVRSALVRTGLGSDMVFEAKDAPDFIGDTLLDVVSQFMLLQ